MVRAGQFGPVRNMFDCLGSRRFLNQSALNYSPSRGAPISAGSQIRRPSPVGQYVPRTAKSLPPTCPLCVRLAGAPGYLNLFSQNSSPFQPVLVADGLDLPAIQRAPQPLLVRSTVAAGPRRYSQHYGRPCGLAKAILKRSQAVVLGYPGRRSATADPTCCKPTFPKPIHHKMAAPWPIPLPMHCLPISIKPAAFAPLGHTPVPSRDRCSLRPAKRRAPSPLSCHLDRPRTRSPTWQPATDSTGTIWKRLNLGRAPLSGGNQCTRANYFSDWNPVGCISRNEPCGGFTLNHCSSILSIS